MPETLSTEQLRRAVLGRQGLLTPHRTSLPKAVERMAGIQAQYAPSAYVGLRARLHGFAREDLTRALERRWVIQGTLMRGTIHIVSRGDYWPIAAALREPRRRWHLRVAGDGRTAADMRRVAQRVRSALEDGPMRRNDIFAALGIDSSDWHGVGYWVDLVRIPPSGTWERRRADRYGLAEQWVGPDDGDPDIGLELLVSRYLAGFGPASRADIQAFTQLPMALLSRVLGRMVLRTFHSPVGDELLDLPRLRMRQADAPAVTFLGHWDALLLAHARRTQILPEEHRDKVFHTKIPQSVATFLINGQVRGSWRYRDGRVHLEPFETLSAPALRSVRLSSSELEAFLA